MEEKKTGRRRFPRIPAQLDLGVRLASEKKSLPMVSAVHEVGLGGCRFMSKVSYGVGARLWLTIIPKKSIVEAQARVVYELPKRDKTFEIGVEFVQISDRDRATLEKLLAPPEAPKAESRA